uniref:Protein kinase domain-containing protein n=1 Tax=Chenopodium quinoa TaxID=63459 RepID=A0A803KST9_CHEQI
MDEVNLRDGGELSNELPSSSPSLASGFFPRQLAFRPYVFSQESSNKSKALRVVVRRPLVAKLTKHIVETYQECNPDFKYTDELNLKRFLTSPSDGVFNDGHDNATSDLILSVNYALVNSHTQRRYVVKDILGHGTFGQVAKCWVPDTNSFVAVKIIKNQPAYYQQAWVEVSILTTLNKKLDPEDKHHIVRIHDYFVFQRHLCISFELLDTNLYELIKLNNFKGLSLSIVQLFSKQILRGLGLMKDAGIIHCDLKPENILLCTSMKPAEIKIIDFGSACMEDKTVYSYIQSRYYRSPEVLLGYQYTTAIDMWSFGCIVAELFLGLPLFPGASEFDLLRRMIRILGGQPPDYLLKDAKSTNKFFKFVGSVDHVDAGHDSMGGRSAYQALSEEEYEAREKKKPMIGKEYFNYMNLEGIVVAYPYKKNLPEEDIIKERQVRLALIDFLRGLVEFDPAKRWSPFQALKHPFVTGEPFTSPYIPVSETPHVPVSTVSQNFKVDHHPGGGHWFAAGLSPHVSGRTVSMHASPHIQIQPYAQSSSYGSLGSHNSYNDGNMLGSSYGSYGDNFNTFTYFSPGCQSTMNVHTQGGKAMVGNSPDTRWKIYHRPQGPHGLGVSPSAGNFAPFPLGISPSQFTPPSSFTQNSGSPGHYSAASPARGNCQGSPLGKGIAVSNFNRRKSWGHSGNMQSQEGTSTAHCQGQLSGGLCFSQGEGNTQSQVPGGPLHIPINSNMSSWKPPSGSSNISTDNSFSHMPISGLHGSSLQFSQIKRPVDEKLDVTALPDPGDWDPNYSDELLLQEDSSDVSSITSAFGKVVNIDQATTSPQTFGFGTYSHDSNAVSNATWRPSGPAQAFSKPDMNSPPAHNLPLGYGRSMLRAPQYMSQLSPTSLSRLGQPPTQRTNHGRSSVTYGNEGIHMRPHHNSYSYDPGYPHNSMPWGMHKLDPDISSSSKFVFPHM